MLSQNDLERERYLARIKVQRDELSRLHSAREEGREQGLELGRKLTLERGQYIGAIHAYQDWLKQIPTPVEELLPRSLKDLAALAERLKQQLIK